MRYLSFVLLFSLCSLPVMAADAIYNLSPRSFTTTWQMMGVSGYQLSTRYQKDEKAFSQITTASPMRDDIQAQSVRPRNMSHLGKLRVKGDTQAFVAVKSYSAVKLASFHLKDNQSRIISFYANRVIMNNHSILMRKA